MPALGIVSVPEARPLSRSPVPSMPISVAASPQGTAVSKSAEAIPARTADVKVAINCVFMVCVVVI